MKNLYYITLILTIVAHTQIIPNTTRNVNLQECKPTIFTKNHTIQITNTANYPIIINISTAHNYLDEQGNCWAQTKQENPLEIAAATTTSYQYLGVIYSIKVINKNNHSKMTKYKTYSNTNKTPQKLTIKDTPKNPGQPIIDTSDFIKK
jgi:hypothetical protein